MFKIIIEEIPEKGRIKVDISTEFAIDTKMLIGFLAAMRESGLNERIANIIANHQAEQKDEPENNIHFQ